LGISYPNDQDRAHAAAQGKPTGGDIFIHGGPPHRVTKRDWTAGCIAVTDRQIEVIYSMVKPGTPILILP
jgi:murein L,D-transpeptidase YafK